MYIVIQSIESMVCCLEAAIVSGKSDEAASENFRNLPFVYIYIYIHIYTYIHIYIHTNIHT